MNRATRGIGLLLVTTSAACAAELEPPPEAEHLAEAPPKLERAAKPAAPEGARFSSRVLDRLAEHGIEVHGGPKPMTQSAPNAERAPERTTVEQRWIVQGHTMQRVEQNNPGNPPHKFAVQLTMRAPRQILGADRFYFDPTYPGREAHCSGTLVGSTAVLTAAHCIVEYLPVGVIPGTSPRQVQWDSVPMYSIDASPRRNGDDFPVKSIPVKRSFWEFSNWPGTNTEGGRNPADYDYAVVRLKRSVPTSIPFASRRVIASPVGKNIDMAHYPFQEARGFRMFYSVGDIGSLHPLFTRVYRHNASAETESSGSGVFEAGADTVSGVNVGEAAIRGLRENRVPGQIVGPNSAAGPHPNFALMLTPASDANVSAWISTLLL